MLKIEMVEQKPSKSKLNIAKRLCQASHQLQHRKMPKHNVSRTKSEKLFGIGKKTVYSKAFHKICNQTTHKTYRKNLL